MPMFDKLQAIEERYDKLLALISDQSVQSDPNEYRTHAKAAYRDPAARREVS